MAMAGERAFAGSLREVSGICTHPDYQGHGFARRLTAKLIRRQLLRGETPFLHVMRSNEAARAVSSHGLHRPPRIGGASDTVDLILSVDARSSSDIRQSASSIAKSPSTEITSPSCIRVSSSTEI